MAEEKEQERGATMWGSGAAKWGKEPEWMEE